MRIRFLIAGFVLLVLTFVSQGCDRSGSTGQSTLPTATMRIGNNTYTLEIAAKDFEREHGLMQRDSMPNDHGMIFVFQSARLLDFWMKNTRIPLDILYLDASGNIVSIHHMDPYVTDSVSSGGPAQYAIELNAGQAAASGVKAGDPLQLPDAIKNAKADPH